MPLNMIVCCKQVLDPEAPPASFKIDPASNKVVPPPGVAPVISPFDEQAVEAALRIKDKQGGKITIISLGTNLLRDVVKKPLSMGADELILLEDEAFEGGDSWSTAYALAMAIKKIGEFDLIFCGRQAADWDAGQVGSGIADGYQVVEVTLPALITTSNELGEARYATLKGIMAAAKKQPTIWKPADIGADTSKIGVAGRKTKLLKLFQPVKEGKCDIVEADSPAEAGAKLAAKLREAKLI